MLNRVVQVATPYGSREVVIIPAWDKFIKQVLVLNGAAAIPDKHDRYLLDQGIRNRIPSSAGRAVKTIEAFMSDWLNQPEHRKTLEGRIKTNPLLSDVHLLVGKPKQDGSVSVSLATRKGFIVVTFPADRFSA